MSVRIGLIVTVCFIPSTHTFVHADDVPQSFALPQSDDGLPGTGPIRRYDWFRKLWKSRRTAFAGEISKKQGAVVFLGDSITQGWGPTFKDHFPGLNAANRGISGDTTRGMLIRLNQDVLSLNPSAVVILMGTNDLEEGASPETISGNVELIIAALKKHSATMPIVLCRVFPSSANLKRPATAIQKLNELNETAVRGDAQITVLDTWTLFANEHGDANQTEFPDLLHPNQAGYAMWAKALVPIFATLGYLETKPDDFQIESGFRSLFNGRDLTGWGFRPKEHEPQYFSSSSTPDGRYVALNDRLIVTTPAEGRRFQQLWTKEEFTGDFTLKLEFRATPNADSGVFIRKPQLQCRDYVLAGPYTELKKYRQQDWNELVVVVNDNVAHCTCNGEILEAEFRLPESGPIGLEGDRGQMEYRRIRIRKD
ncbi:MAG: GDSL-type esterase/lipase family protein [Fuerstiella sp.]|nr:GDSL-type esterase/lipase family protein [Fuerstiella sp.]